MERVTEPELMEQPLQVAAYTNADFDSSDKEFISKLHELLMAKGIKPDSKTLFLDLGCGPGNITTGLTLAWPESKVVGIDGSAEMLKHANKIIKTNKFKNHVQNISYYLSNLSFDSNALVEFRNSANVLVSNSLLHHFHCPNLFWKAIKELAAPGAIIFNRDLRRPSSLKIAIELQRKYLPNAPEILTRDYLASLGASFTVAEVRNQLKNSGMNSLKVLPINDLYLEISGII